MLDHQQQQLQVLSLSPAACWSYGQHSPSQVGGTCGSPAGSVDLSELGEANLLEMLQVLTKRRDELRLMDKQLFDLMSECFVRLKPAAGGGGGGEQLPSGGQQAAIDLSRLSSGSPLGDELRQSGAENEQDGAQGKGKRGANSRHSPSVHIKKMRLLSGIVRQDDIGEKQQVLAEKELDVRESGGDDEAKSKRMIWNTTSSLTSSSASPPPPSSSSSSLSSTPSEAYQQLLAAAAVNSSNSSPLDSTHRLESTSAARDARFNLGDEERAAAAAAASRRSAAYREPLAALSAAAIKFQLTSGLALSSATSGSGGSSSSGDSASDQDDELALDPSGGAGDALCAPARPQLKRFSSIGTAEMSFERSLRQQHLIDSTLATLVQQQQQQQASQQFGANNTMLMPTAALSTGADYFGLQPTAGAFGGAVRQRDVSMLAPLVLQQQQQAPMQHGRFVACEQGAACNKSLAGSSSAVLPLAGAAQQPLALYQRHARMQEHQQKQLDMSPFDRLLVGARGDLAPIVRKMSFRCHVCSSCFEDRHRLQQHLSIHLNLHPSWFEEKTIKETMAQYELRRGDYLCQVCQLRYETTAEFDKHMQLHGEKPHACELCQQDNKFVSFRYFRQLLTHLRSHCFLYSCRFVPECRQTANRKDYLKLHILKHHLNNKLPEQSTIYCH